MKPQYLIFILATFLLNIPSYAQESDQLRHHQIIATIGHAAIPSSEEEGSSNVFIAVPTWGLAYEYDFTEMVGLGLKSDIEVSNYQIRDNEEQTIVREYPVSLVVFVKVIPVAGFGIYAGGGIEFAGEDNLSVFNVGFSYDVDFLERWILAPEIGYELKGGHTNVFTVGLSVGCRFGK
jgi:opacity protein-like surface antigen